MNTVFVSFDYDNDKHYKYLLEAWHKNPRFQFTFDDGTPEEINSSNVGRIKAALTLKIKNATHVLVIAGDNVNTLHRSRELIGKRNWINFEVSQAVALRKYIAVVKLSSTSQVPAELTGKQYSVVSSFSEVNVMWAINNARMNF